MAVLVKAGIWFAIVLACAVSSPRSARADWQAVEKVETYAVSGRTGIELYESIGERGPKAGIGRAIAYTTFDLKWSRKYVPEGSTCRLASARPHLTIITRLPKPADKLTAPTQMRWDKFIAGITAHERVHGEIIVDMVKAIKATSVGLTVADDADCKKIRKELTNRLRGLSDEQREKSRDFDRAEMRDGGNVHQLVLGLVNGG
jgi:predicted secreted Zn-dependent protease